jgi:iron-sulfur cluster assembly accessory protein
MSEGTVTFESKMSMVVTDVAKQHFVKTLDGKPINNYLIRVSVQPGGCSGASYGMAFGGKLEEGELELNANGVRLAVLPEHAAVLNGLTIDYVDEMMGGGFKIHNPNATSSCGCGKSFSA